jgi:carboxyl-terminal processing protease
MKVVPMRLMIALFLIFSVFQPKISAEEELLQVSDVHKIMEQIFARHVDKKQMSSEIIRHAFKLYIEQFDPQGTYLLESEVTPYLKMNEQQVAKVVAEYKEGNYEAFEALNKLFQKSIVRARGIRESLEQNPQGLLKSMAGAPQPAKQIDYPDDLAQLNDRIRGELAAYLQSEIKRYGERPAAGADSKLLKDYESRLRENEDGYLYTHRDGSPLSPQEKENLFVLHVLKALAKSLDAHTDVFNQNEAYDMRVRLEKGFDGVGIVFNQNAQGIVVSNLIENGPAAKQGEIKPGDLLISINGTDIQGSPFEKVMELLKGSKGEKVELGWKRKVKDKESTFTVTLQRETIVLDKDRVQVSSEKFGNGIIGRITLHSFYQNDQGINSEADVRAAIDKLDAQGNLRALILDLRDNSGGFLSQAVKVAGLFITNGVIVVSKYSNGEEKIYRDMDGKVAYDGPLIVLTSKATASAAEIVAQAIQDYGVGVIVGDEQTYGKGTIQSQTVTENKGSSLFKVTVGKYYTVSGKTPQLQGVKADIVVPGPFSKLQFGEEDLEYTLKGEDRINPAFTDKLQDIDPNLKPWYLKYYMPTLQHRTNLWKAQLPLLKKNSAYRLANNKNYQLFLKRLNGEEPAKEEEDELSEERGTKSRGFGENDLQLAEAFNVAKDMAYLQAKAKEQDLMVGSERN